MISRFLDKKLIKTPIVECDAICAFTGKKISEGVEKSKLISNTFTDFDLIKYNSKFVSVDIALKLSNVILTDKGRYNPLRNYSFFCNEDGYQLLKREDILDKVLNIDCDKFQICVTFSNKKHIAYRSVIQTNQRNFVITTDVGHIPFNLDDVDKVLPTMQKWYSVPPDNKSSQEPTFFTKAEIKGETIPNYKKILAYGFTQYFNDTELLNKYRDTNFMMLLTHMLNKTKNV